MILKSGNQIMRILLLIAVLFITSCSNVKVINRQDDSPPPMQGSYSEPFMKDIAKAKELYRTGKGSDALKFLSTIDVKKISTIEDALRLNLIGVIYFSSGKYDLAIKNFDGARSKSDTDPVLLAQVELNLASGHYRLGSFEKSHEVLLKCDYRLLSRPDAEKRHLLLMEISRTLNNRIDFINASILYLERRQSIADIKADRSFLTLLTFFFELGERERLRLLEDKKEGSPLVVGYLGHLDGEKKFNMGKTEEGKEEIDWVADNFSNHEELKQLTKSFGDRQVTFANLNPQVIGVVLPLSGEKRAFGERALLGIQSALLELNKDGRSFKIEVRDTEGSATIGANHVRELIDNHSVAAVVGGLFPQAATTEYLEAKMSGVPFISLSQVHLGREKKDHLLLEIPGSIESQINQLFSGQVLEKIGKRGAILYPKSQKGDVYVEEFWRESQKRGVAVNNAISFERDKTDYREPVQNLLGLKYLRERADEQAFLAEIYSHEKNKSLKRVQVLRPDANYDWVFIPSSPLEALQIIPAFSYFDAPRLKLIGDQSWRAETLAKESNKIDGLFFVGEGMSERQDNFATKFASTHKVAPKIIEMSAYDAVKIVGTLIKSDQSADRTLLDSRIRSETTLTGVTGSWKLLDGIWIKDMAFLKLSKGKIETGI